MTPFALSHMSNFEKMLVVVDKGVFDVELLGFRMFASDKSAFLSASDLKLYFEKLETSHELVDFSSLASAQIAAPSEKKKAPYNYNHENDSRMQKKEKGTKEETKEVKIGIEAKKEEDFPNWYTQVLVRTEMMDYYDIRLLINISN